jgi:hypothetical protein
VLSSALFLVGAGLTASGDYDLQAENEQIKQGVKIKREANK